MCGIAGVYRGRESTVNQMLDKIEHRGGDGRGVKVLGDAIHGHVRLALLDTTEGSAQPFVLDGTVLSFNGEIWNYKHLKGYMFETGFKTTGDTEVLAHWLNNKGVEGLNALSGMFCFAWTKNNRTIICRDAFGEIPVYIAQTKDGYCWASERKAFLGLPGTTMPRALPPGYYFDTQSGKFIKWYAPDGRAKQLDKQLTKPFLKQRLVEGVNQRLHADANVAALISGGLDSSIILTLAKQTNPGVVAYTAVYDPNSDDLKNSRIICNELEVPLVEVIVPVTDQAVTESLQAIEISSKAQIEIGVLCSPLAAAIKSDGFKACLSGEAADELFGGYGNFCIKANKATEAEVISLRKAQLAKMSRGNFVRCNKIFMRHGVECRLPFMDKQLVEKAVLTGKALSPLGKRILKDTFGGVVSDKIIKRTKDTFQGGSGVSSYLATLYDSPTRYYNSALKAEFGYLPKD